MASRRRVSRRQRILVVAEGESERALAHWFRELCNDQGRRLHLDIVVAGGGDSRVIVQYAVNQRRRRNEGRIRDSGALVFVDADRVSADRDAGRDPEGVRDRGNLQLVYLKPNLEGLLVRLHRGHETRFLAPQDAARRLRQLWQDYDKPVSAAALRQRFDLNDLRRAAQHDPNLRAALAQLGL